MIGYWDYTVIITFVSLVSSIVGMVFAAEGRFTEAIVCLALSGLLDGLDGKVARRKKNRTEEERANGIQLDSLCDVICFGAFPALLCYEMGLSGLIGIALMAVYCIFAVVRLAYFNVLESVRQQSEGGANKDYHGLPVTSIAAIFPIVYLVSFWVSGDCKPVALGVMLLLTGVLFVVDFRVKKPNLVQFWLLIGAVTAVLSAAIYFYHWY